MIRKYFPLSVFLVLALTLTSQPPQTGPSIGLAEPRYRADFTPVIANGYHGVSWSNGYVVSFGLGEMKEPVTLYDKAGKWLFANPLTFQNAVRVYGQDAVATQSGTVIVAASAINGDGTAADMIVELDKQGVRRVIRTTPFYPFKICVTKEGTVWAYGHELTADRRAEPRQHFALLREYSFERGELRATLDRATVHTPSGVPLNGSRGDVYLQCSSDKVVLANGAVNELIEYNRISNTLSRWPIASLGDGFYMTGAAVTDAGEVYISTLRPGKNSVTDMLHLHVNSSSGIAEGTSLSSNSAAGGTFFILLGNDGEDLVYSQGRRSPTLFWSSAPKAGVMK